MQVWFSHDDAINCNVEFNKQKKAHVLQGELQEIQDKNGRINDAITK